MMPHQSQAPSATCSASVHLVARSTVKKNKRRVTFQPMLIVQPVDCRMSHEEKSNSYYSKDELDVFHREVKEICKRAMPSNDVPGMIGVEDPVGRGLELKLCPVRARAKTLVRKALLKQQKKANANPNTTSEQKLLFVAKASAALGRWSRMVALETARLDALRAYEADYLIPIDSPVDIPRFPFLATKPKRRVTVDEEDSRPAKRSRSC